MNPLQTLHGDWAVKQFPSAFKDGKPNPRAPFNHLTDPTKGEVWELGVALDLGNRDHICMELADCQLLLYSIAHLCGIDLESAAWNKYEINIKRQWGEPDENGVVEHIPSTPHEAEQAAAAKLRNGPYPFIENPSKFKEP